MPVQRVCAAAVSMRDTASWQRCSGGAASRGGAAAKVRRRRAWESGPSWSARSGRLLSAGPGLRRGRRLACGPPSIQRQGSAFMKHDLWARDAVAAVRANAHVPVCRPACLR